MIGTRPGALRSERSKHSIAAFQSPIFIAKRPSASVGVGSLPAKRAAVFIASM